MAICLLRAQTLMVYKTDGSIDNYCISEMDSIVFLEESYATPHNQNANITLNLSTDSACYHPGATVQFTLSSSIPNGARVRYMHLGRVLKEHDLKARTWQWTTPAEDFRGYMVQVYVPGSEAETVRGTIAVDVSSDWRRFPRYGFVATFGTNKTETVVANEMNWLSRCHINGVQFQDWHWKHHWPWGGKDGNEYEQYTDIANRTNSTATIRRYIKAQHQRGMKSIFYNLCYGVLDDAQDDGVKSSWYLFKDANLTKKDFHDLPDNWKSDIFLVNPGALEWQRYLGDRNDEVYSHLDFDGYQVDQLGNRGTLYNSTGRSISIPAAFQSFLRAMKARHPEKRLVMNAVSSYGTDRIVKSGVVDFLYNEVWNDEATFQDLYNILQTNDRNSADTLRTVFAAYMNYKLDNTEFNMPGVLLTDAVMFALGGSHLELGGDHMLCREYFPYSSVTMSSTLKTQITRYYDFLTAYENLLRDGGTLCTDKAFVPVCTDASRQLSINGWAPQLGGITTIARQKDDCTVVHLLNFIRANSLSWRDMDGSMPAASVLKNIPLQFNWSQPVHHVYVATPDSHGGAMQELDFVQENERLSLTLPILNYWTMLVME